MNALQSLRLLRAAYLIDVKCWITPSGRVQKRAVLSVCRFDADELVTVDLAIPHAIAHAVGIPEVPDTRLHQAELDRINKDIRSAVAVDPVYRSALETRRNKAQLRKAVKKLATLAEKTSVSVDDVVVSVVEAVNKQIVRSVMVS